MFERNTSETATLHGIDAGIARRTALTQRSIAYAESQFLNVVQKDRLAAAGSFGECE